MKKLLSLLLALAMFAGLALPGNGGGARNDRILVQL